MILAFQPFVNIEENYNAEKREALYVEIGQHFKQRIISFLHEIGLHEDEYRVLEEYYEGFLLIIEFKDTLDKCVIYSCDFAHIGEVERI